MAYLLVAPRRSTGLTLGRTGPWFLPRHYRMPQSVRPSHMYVIGSSGNGKSKFLEHCLFQDIAAGRGCGLLDPHAQLVDHLLSGLITRKVLTDPVIRERLIYVDPARKDYVVPFNVLATPGEPYEVAASVLEAFRRTWPDSLREAPHFSNVFTSALLAMIENKLTLMHTQRFLTNREWREECLKKVTDPNVIEFFHDRYEQWGRDAPVMRESTLNKVAAFSLNPRLRLMLGQQENHLDFQAIMDEGKILLVNLGNSDPETNRLIGSLIVTGLELAMRRRRSQLLWNLTIDEFAAYMANEGSAQTLAHVFSEGRKFGMGMTVAHQDLSQLTPRMIGAISNVKTKVIFGIGRYDAEYLAKLIGRVNTEAIKRDPKAETQHELFSPVMEQWEDWTDRLRGQPPRQATVATHDHRVINLKTITIPKPTATEQQVEEVRQDSLKRYGIPYTQAEQTVQANSAANGPTASTEIDLPAYEVVAA